MVIIDHLLDFYHGDGDGDDDGDGPTIDISPQARLLARLGAMLQRWPYHPTLARDTLQTRVCDVLAQG
jgi:hypothetical protein